MAQAESVFTPLRIAVLTVSDTRTSATDSSGDLLVARLQQAGHQLIYALRAVVSAWIVDPKVQAIVVTGGTGFSARDSTPEALCPLFDKPIEGFGELFRQVSLEDIGTSTIQSRALAGVANYTVIFCLPGSNNACATGWDRIIASQLDSRQRPCNFVGLVQKKGQSA